MRKIAKLLCPPPIWRFLGNLRRKWITRDDHRLNARDVFTRIYDRRVWGSNGPFDSGDGSRDSHVVDRYISTVTQWCTNHASANLTAIDLGCGDYRIGRCLSGLFKNYTGCDIVESLIKHHRQNYSSDQVSFLCLDAIEEPLPAGDVLFIRQVLQHLSNEQIARIVPKIRQFAHAIVTEHLPSGTNWTANADKVHGGGLRLGVKSGVVLIEHPFDLVFQSSEVLLEVPANPKNSGDGVIRTTWYRM